MRFALLVCLVLTFLSSCRNASRQLSSNDPLNKEYLDSERKRRLSFSDSVQIVSQQKTDSVLKAVDFIDTSYKYAELHRTANELLTANTTKEAQAMLRYLKSMEQLYLEYYRAWLPKAAVTEALGVIQRGAAVVDHREL